MFNPTTHLTQNAPVRNSTDDTAGLDYAFSVFTGAYLTATFYLVIYAIYLRSMPASLSKGRPSWFIIGLHVVNWLFIVADCQWSSQSSHRFSDNYNWTSNHCVFVRNYSLQGDYGKEKPWLLWASVHIYTHRRHTVRIVQEITWFEGSSHFKTRNFIMLLVLSSCVWHKMPAWKPTPPPPPPPPPPRPIPQP